LVQFNSPNPTIDRTFQAVFELPQEQKRTQTKPVRRYRNPVIVAQEWQEILDHENYTPADLARKFKVSRAHVTQVLRLLRLTPEVLQHIALFADHFPSPIITERMLRPLVDLSPEEQKHSIAAILRRKGIPTNHSFRKSVSGA
jgi:hypothetical protein